MFEGSKTNAPFNFVNKGSAWMDSLMKASLSSDNFAYICQCTDYSEDIQLL